MTDNKEYWGTPSDRGNIKISEEVITSIASIAVSETEGADQITNPISDIAGFLGKKQSKGIKVAFVYDNVEIDITCQTKFGHSVYEVAKDIQENVKSSVESMTGLTCTAINVSITGITFEKE